jgi:hypothetical protein
MHPYQEIACQIFFPKSIIYFIYFYTFALLNVAEQMAELRKINITTAKKVYIHIQICLIMEPCRKHIYLIERYHCTY